MSYVDRSLYNNPEEKSFDLKDWIAYMVVMKKISQDPKFMEMLDMLGTSTYVQQIKSNIIFEDNIKDEKLVEIRKIKKVITETIDLKIITHWLPGVDLPKECLFLQCELDESILSDYTKFSKLEVDMYLSVKNILDKSKFFDMVAII